MCFLEVMVWTDYIVAVRNCSQNNIKALVSTSSPPEGGRGEVLQRAAAVTFLYFEDKLCIL